MPTKPSFNGTLDEGGILSLDCNSDAESNDDSSSERSVQGSSEDDVDSRQKDGNCPVQVELQLSENGEVLDYQTDQDKTLDELEVITHKGNIF